MTDTFTVLDIETSGDMPWKHNLVAVGVGECKKSTHREQVLKPAAGMAKVAKILSDPKSLVVAHTNFDLRWLILNGAPFVEGVRYHDTKVMAFMLDQTMGQLSLDDLAQRYLGLEGLRKPIRVRRRGTPQKRILYDLNGGFGLWEEFWLARYVEEHADDQDIKDFLAGIVPIEDVPWTEMVAYNGQDIGVTADLYRCLREHLTDSGQWERYFLSEEAPLSRLLIEMEVVGMPIDAQGTRDFLAVADKERQQLHHELLEETGAAYGFSLTNGDDVAAYLYDELPTFKVQIEVPALLTMKPAARAELVDRMLPSQIRVDRIGSKYVYGTETIAGKGFRPPKAKKKKGVESRRPPVDAENLVLHFGDDAWVTKYLRWKSLNTLCNNYLEVWVEVEHDGRLHGRFDQARAETGRISSRDPNLQAIPVSGEDSIRHLFATRMMIGDYSGLDARVAAHFSADPVMLDIFRNERDLYGTLAAEAWGGTPDKKNPNRGLMKILMLSSQYGAQAGSIGDKIRISGLGEKYAKQAGKLLRDLEETLGVMFAWREDVLREAKSTGYIETITGRRRYLPDLYSNEWWRKARAERQVVASKVQGTSADIVRRAMLRTRQEVPPSVATMILQVHDEILWECGPDWEDSYFDRIVEICDAGHTLPLLVPDTGEFIPGFELLIPMRFSAAMGDSWEDKDAQGARSYRQMAGSHAG